MGIADNLLIRAKARAREKRITLRSLIEKSLAATIDQPPAPLAIALDTLRAWQESPGLRLLGEGPGYFETLSRQASAGQINGAKIHDARTLADLSGAVDIRPTDILEAIQYRSLGRKLSA